MKKIFFVSLFALLLFSGCLIQPQVSVKSVKDSGENILVELHSNKQLNADVKLKDQSENVLCQENVVLNQGNTVFGMKCNLTDSVVVVEVLAEGVVFSDSVEVELDESNVKGKVLELTETTIEGELLAVFESNLASADQCSAQMLVDNMNKYYDYIVSVDPNNAGYLPDLGLDNLTHAQMQELQENIDNVKSCKLRVVKKINSLGDSKYSVNYSMVSENCESALGYGAPKTERDAVIIEVNLKNDSTEVTKGSMSNSYTAPEQQRQQIQAYRLLGPCMKQMLLGTYISVILPPKEPAEPGDTEVIKIIDENSSEILQDNNVSTIDENESLP
jgi:hypothetical protein